jgi:2-keto-3-deoxy-L-rhamnonate aldolase RhmA
VELYLFTSDPEVAGRSAAAGVDGFVVDWERDGKEFRQADADTEINSDTPEDLERIRGVTAAPILCRINPVGSRTEEEVEAAVARGASEILVPMVRRVEEVGAVLERTAGRLGVGILIETEQAVERAHELAALPLSRVYVGLNDLAIERRSPSIFTALADGTVERVREAVDVPFGVAGMTVPWAGSPIPARLLTAELVRLGCRFTFLRRSFRRDVAGHDLGAALTAMREAIRRASARTEREVRRDRAELVARIADLARPALAGERARA